MKENVPIFVNFLKPSKGETLLRPPPPPDAKVSVSTPQLIHVNW